MFSHCHSFVAVLAATAGIISPGLAASRFRVCADPNNLPFSNQRGEGFENRLAELMARDLGAKLQYTWFTQRKSFIKNSLEAGRCDILMGVPAAMNSVAVTRPYYRSTYVFVSRKDRHLQLKSLHDSRLADWRIGIHVVGDDYAPPAVALGRRGLAANIKGYSLAGAYGDRNPPAKLISAVSAGDVDVAIVWGPFAGYFARREPVALDIEPVSPAMELGVPFAFDISMAVRMDDGPMKARLDEALSRNCAQIRSILDDYGIPRVTGEERPCASQP